MNLLFITEICPFPVHGGEKIRTYGLLNIFSGLKYNTTAVIGKRIKKEDEIIPFNNTRFIEFNFEEIIPEGKWTRVFSYFRKNKKLITLFTDLIIKSKPDVVYIDYKYYGQYISFFKKRNIPVIYGTHNAQSKITRHRPPVSFCNKIANIIESSFYLFHEKYYFRKANALITVSREDKLFHSRFISLEKIYVLPNFLVLKDYINIKAINKSDIIMSGNFIAYQNFAGLEWFVKNIWSTEKNGTYILKLVGLGSKEALEKIKNQYKVNNIEALGQVDDLKPYIANAKVSIVPLLHGSGTRLKCIEAMALKTQILSTSKGAEGIEHNNSIIIADNPEDFKNKLYSILNDKLNFTEEAYDIFILKYSLEANQLIFKTVIENI